MSRFFKNSILTMSTNMFLLIGALVISVVIARLLGPELKGIYTMVLLLPYMLFSFLNFGVGVGVVYFTSNKRFSKTVIIGNNIILFIALSILSSIVGLVIIFLLKDNYFALVPVRLLILSLVIVPLRLFENLFAAVLHGREDFKKFNLLPIVYKLVFLFLLIFLFFYPEIWFALIINIITLVVNIFMLYVWVIKPEQKNLILYKGEYLKELFKYGIKNYLNNIITFFNYKIDLFLIIYFLDPLALGYYSVAVAIAEKVWLLSRSVSTVLLPRISALDTEKEKNDLTSLTCRVVIFITFITCLILYLLSTQIILRLYSNVFLDAIIPLRLLLIGTFTLSISGVLTNALAGRGKPIYGTYANTIALVFNFILNIILIPPNGINGAAMATAVAYGINSIFMVFFYCRLTGTNVLNIIFIRIADIKNIIRNVREIF